MALRQTVLIALLLPLHVQIWVGELKQKIHWQKHGLIQCFILDPFYYYYYYFGITENFTDCLMIDEIDQSN